MSSDSPFNVSSQFLFPVQSNGRFSIVETDTVEWPELSHTFSTHAIQLPILLSPPLTQVEPFFHAACRKARIPSTTASVYNLQGAVATIRQLRQDALISTTKLATELLKLIRSQDDDGELLKIIFLYTHEQLSRDDIARVTACAPHAKIVGGVHPISQYLP